MDFNYVFLTDNFFCLVKKFSKLGVVENVVGYRLMVGWLASSTELSSYSSQQETYTCLGHRADTALPMDVCPEIVQPLMLSRYFELIQKKNNCWNPLLKMSFLTSSVGFYSS